MKFTSTKDSSVSVSLKEAVLGNMPRGGGLFTPIDIPKIDPAFIRSLIGKKFHEVSYAVLSRLVGDEIPAPVLSRLCENAHCFDVPVRKLAEDIYTLELFHGPTLAFKDVGVRFMAELLAWYNQDENRAITILTATSGDTGGAVASAFFNRPGFEVVILYPKGKVSGLQELQIAGLGGNIKAIEVRGNFDDCQRMAKAALSDDEIRIVRHFSSANSINVARLLPQVAYYFYAWSQLKDGRPVTFSVPSGNFGNICAGLIAKEMGLPVSKLIAATNRNDIVPRYLSSGVYDVRDFFETLSTAMDIADPSNFVRALHLYGNSKDKIAEDVVGVSVSDDETRSAMQDLYARYGYISEPHGAVAYNALLRGKSSTPSDGIFLGTAHPVKFKDIVESTLGAAVATPSNNVSFGLLEKQSIEIEADVGVLKNILRDSI